MDKDKDLEGVAFAQEEIKRNSAQAKGSIHFHPLDLSSIETAKRSANEFKNKTGEAGKRLDIIIGNAGIAFPPLNQLSQDGYERTFAVNCLGHFVFIMELLGALPVGLRSDTFQSFSACSNFRLTICLQI